MREIQCNIKMLTGVVQVEMMIQGKRYILIF